MNNWLILGLAGAVLATGVTIVNANYDGIRGAIGTGLQELADEGHQAREDHIATTFAGITDQADLIVAQDADNAFAILRAANRTKRVFLAKVFEDETTTQAAVLIAPDAGSTETVWLFNLREDRNGTMTGDVLTPISQGRGYGKELPFAVSQIRDWAVTKDNQVYGLFVVRENLDHYDTVKQEQVQAMLSETPLPASWSN